MLRSGWNPIDSTNKMLQNWHLSPTPSVIIEGKKSKQVLIRCLVHTNSGRQGVTHVLLIICVAPPDV